MTDIILKNKKDKDYIDLVIQSINSVNNYNNMNLSEINRKSLNEMINYLSKLRKEKMLDEKQFSELLSLACVNFIENEVENRVSKVLNEKLFYFIGKLS